MGDQEESHDDLINQLKQTEPIVNKQDYVVVKAEKLETAITPAIEGYRADQNDKITKDGSIVQSPDNSCNNQLVEIDQPVKDESVIKSEEYPKQGEPNLTYEPPEPKMQSEDVFSIKDNPVKLEDTNKLKDDPVKQETANKKPEGAPAKATQASSTDKSDKANMYKALAIKLKKELVKLREDTSGLSERAELLDITNINLEAKVKILQQQLDSTENDLQSLQDEFENYKVRASEIMQQNNANRKISSHTFEDNLYKQLKELNLEHQKRISNLESQLSISLEKNSEQEREYKLLLDKVKLTDEYLITIKNLEIKTKTLTRENENLKLAIKQFRTQLIEPVCSEDIGNSSENDLKSNEANTAIQQTSDAKLHNSDQQEEAEEHEAITSRRDGSPSASLKDHDSQTTSSSSFDGSTSGYVHIRPTTFEIISRSSVLEDTQNQIDNLTKAYLDSESTNSLLTEQVSALKEEIRRLQRGTERMDLADNLEYLKNILFKFLTLDNSQSEQKQRLIPVLSTVLKLSPEETTKLHTLTVIDKPGMASSFFKLG